MESITILDLWEACDVQAVTRAAEACPGIAAQLRALEDACATLEADVCSRLLEAMPSTAVDWQEVYRGA